MPIFSLTGRPPFIKGGVLIRPRTTQTVIIPGTLSGYTVAASETSGLLSLAVSLQGSVSVTGLATATATMAGATAFGGSSFAQALTSGSLTLRQFLQGVATAQGTASGILSVNTGNPGIFEDFFNRADETPLESDSRWTVQSGSSPANWKTVGGFAVPTSSQGHTNIIDPQPIDFYTEWMTGPSTGSMDSLYKCRQNTDGSHIAVRVRGSTFQAYSVSTTNTLTALGSGSSAINTAVRVEVIGNTMKLISNGVKTGGDITIPIGFQSGTIHGLFARDSVDPSFADYLRIGSLSAFTV